MQSYQYVPHIRLLLASLRISSERLNGKSKVAIEAPLLKALIQALVAGMEFSEAFYLETYPDVAAAHAAGKIADLQQHFVELGFFEGRCGAPPPVDDAYYNELYPDIADAVRRGELQSPSQHYIGAGSAEGRVPNAALRPVVEYWFSILTDPTARR